MKKLVYALITAGLLTITVALAGPGNQGNVDGGFTELPEELLLQLF